MTTISAPLFKVATAPFVFTKLPDNKVSTIG
jgi:hypothetical protein